MPKRQRVDLKKNLASAVYLSFLFLLSWLPPRLAFRGAQLVGRFRYHWRMRMSPIDIGSRAMYLEMRFGVATEQASRWMKRSYELEAIEDLEIWLYPRLNERNLAKYVRVEGLEQIVAAKEKGKGLVMTSPHVRSMGIAYCALALLGHPMTLLKHQPLEDRLNWAERRLHGRGNAAWIKFGSSFIYTSTSKPFTLQYMGNVLRRNGIVYTPAELSQPGPQRDVEVEFLNQITNFPQGPALIASVHGAPLLDFWIERPPALVPAIIRIGAPITVTKNHADAIQQQATRFGTEILSDPGSWFPWFFPAQ